jgi:hypothetical protein
MNPFQVLDSPAVDGQLVALVGALEVIEDRKGVIVASAPYVIAF